MVKIKIKGDTHKLSEVTGVGVEPYIPGSGVHTLAIDVLKEDGLKTYKYEYINAEKCAAVMRRLVWCMKSYKSIQKRGKNEC
jgi:hypothetical protein